jgi:nicotinamidase-related amidase
MHARRLTDAVIVFCEMQPSIVAFSRTYPETQLRRAAALLSATAETLAIPVFTAVVPLGADLQPELIAELAGHRPRARSAVGIFDDEDLRREIAATGRKLVALAGVSSEIAILHAALGARREGYDVHVLVDGCGGLSERTERSAFGQIEAAGAMLSNISSFLTGLVPDMGSPEGQAVMGGLADLWGWGDPAAAGRHG